MRNATVYDFPNFCAEFLSKIDFCAERLRVMQQRMISPTFVRNFGQNLTLFQHERDLEGPGVYHPVSEPEV